jgi:F-box and WD-40 domain protein CDC4
MKVTDGRISPGPQGDQEDDIIMSPTAGPAGVYPSTSRAKRRSVITRSQPRPIHTPTSPLNSTIPHNLLPSAPASPPTPAPSPTPGARAPDWSTAAEHEDSHVRNIRELFVDMNDAEKQRLLGELLNMCNSQQLAFVHDFVSPRLKKDPFTYLPTELCLRVSLQIASYGQVG